MSTLTANPTVVESDTPRKIWTREEARMLVDLGFPNAEKLELIDGDLIDRMGKKHPHNYWQTLLRLWLEALFGAEFVQVEPSIYVALDDNLKNEPAPDLIVTAKSIRQYKDNVNPAEIRLLIEVSDSTVKFDLSKKAALYAKAGIVEYWVVDIPAQLVHVHRSPEHGSYISIAQCGFQEEISALADPSVRVCLSQL